MQRTEEGRKQSQPYIQLAINFGHIFAQPPLMLAVFHFLRNCVLGEFSSPHKYAAFVIDK